MNTLGVENFREEMLCLCDVMFQGLLSVSRCIQKERERKKENELELDVEHSVPNTHYRSAFDILVV